MRSCFRLLAFAAVLLCPAAAHALNAEPVGVVSAQLSQSWASSCMRVPLGSHAFPPAASDEAADDGVLSFEEAMELAAWGATDALTVTFLNRAGAPVADVPREGGTVHVALTADDDPLVKLAADGESACLLQGTFRDIHPTSIVPVTLDDGRPGRIYFFTYEARWTPAFAQRFAMSSRRIAAALVSFNPGAGWDRIQAFRTEDEGRPFAPDAFKAGGLSRFDFEAAHPDAIRIVEVPDGYPASAQPLTVSYATPVPAAVAACRERDHWEVPDCIHELARGGAILGALSICDRDDTNCLTDLLHAAAPEVVADWCLAVQETSLSSRPRCQAFAALHGQQDEPAEAMPDWLIPRLIRSPGADGGTAFFLRVHSVEYGPLKEFEISERSRDEGTPYLKLSCAAGELGAAMLHAGHSPLWQPGEQVAAKMRGRWDADNDFTLTAADDGTTLAVAGSNVERFLRHALSSESFTLTMPGAADMRSYVSVRGVVGAYGGDMDLPTLLKEAGCGKAVDRALQ